VCRVKDRFTDPSDAGWTDLLMNLYLNEDANKHVCEVQLIHKKMFLQRTTMNGHDAYNKSRACNELLQTVPPKTKRLRSRSRGSSQTETGLFHREHSIFHREHSKVHPLSTIEPEKQSEQQISETAPAPEAEAKAEPEAEAKAEPEAEAKAVETVIEY